MSLQHKIEYSIDLLRKAEPLALKMHPDGFRLAFSGGKDSQVLYHIAKMAGVKFKAHMQITTIDPPELMHFVRTQYHDVTFNHPTTNFYNLIEQMGCLPTRKQRYCCFYLKETSGIGTVTLTGVRAAESNRRKKRNEIETIHRNPKKRKVFQIDQFAVDSEMQHQCILGNDKISIQAIFKLTDNDVWSFIRGNNIEYCCLYDRRYHRIGCVFCPMADPKIKALQRKQYPGIERLIKRSISRIIHSHGYLQRFNATVDEIFNWWVSNETVDEYFGMLRNQTKIKFDDV